jgi:Tfp pilus assembly protein PilX
MLKVVHKGESGAASMIVVIFMSIILTIVTLGFIRIAINEQRTATDDDLSARAYYAAESGLEDAKRAIAKKLVDPTTVLNENTCDPPAGYNAVLSATTEFDTEYTCQLIDFTPSKVTTEFSSPNQVKQFQLKPVDAADNPTTYDSLTLRWHIDAVSPDGDGAVSGGGPVFIRPATATNIPQNGSWNFPAMMKVTLISYPDGTPANRINEPDIVAATVLVSPNTVSGANGFTANVFPGGASVNSAVDKRVYGADCIDSNNNMSCTMVFDLSGIKTAGNRIVDVRISNLYEATTAELTMSDGGTPVFFKDAQVVVDVTGRAGGVYRRVEAALDLTNPNLLPDFAIQSATNICKDFTFTDVTSGFSGGSAGSSCTRE